MRREDRIVFDESTHTYFVDGAKVPLSVTGVIHRYAREFDAHEALRRMALEKRRLQRRGHFANVEAQWGGGKGARATYARANRIPPEWR